MKPLHYIGLVFGLSSLLVMTGCGSSSSSTEEPGTLELAITDAEEDFLTYKIELDAITLNRRDGSKVDILPSGWVERIPTKTLILATYRF